MSDAAARTDTAALTTPEGAAAIRIVLADDHVIVRRGLRLLLEGEPGLEVVAEAGNVDNARHHVRGHRPDVLVLDLNMPGGCSLEAIPAIRAESGGTQIVVLTMQNDPEYAREALAGGAIAYVLKEAADAELVDAIRCASSGQGYLTPSMRALVAPTCTASSGSPRGPRSSATR